MVTATSRSNISWAAYHASAQPAQRLLLLSQHCCLSSLMTPKYVGLIRLSMDVIKQAVQQLNPGQLPVITLDQPLFTITKQIQWNWPASHGEDHFIIILGGLHIEMAGLKVIGDWLEDTGWVEALVQAKVASAGTAYSFRKASHVTRTRHAHQVTASSLYILLKKSYMYAHYKESLEPGSQAE